MTGLRISSKLTLPLDVVTEALGIVATRGAGKSYASAVLIEEAYKAGVQVVVLDPAGVYHGLRSSADGGAGGLPIYVFGGAHGDLPLEAHAGSFIADLVVNSGHSFVLDLTDFTSKASTRTFVATFLERLYFRKGRERTNLMLVVDEADEFAPQITGGRSAPGSLGALETIAKRGRSRGVGVVLITQRTQALNKDVLDLVDTMIAMRLGAPRSRKTVSEWLEVKEAKDELGVIDSLSSLPTGTAWIWSPVRGLLERVDVRRIRTFDSYQTPKPGMARVEATGRAELDLDALGEQMRDTVEQARENDPTALRKRLADAEALARGQAAEIDAYEQERLNAEPERVAVRVEVPVLGDFPVDEFQAMCARLLECGQRLEAGAEEMFARFKRAKEMIESHAAIAPTPPPPAPREAPSRVPARPRPVVPPTANGEVSGPEQKIIDGLAWLEALGIRPGDRVQVAFLAGYKPSGGRFANLLGGARRDGLIDYPASGQVVLTDHGRSLARDPALPRTSAALHEAVLARLNESQQKLLRPLLDAAGTPISRGEVAELAGYDVSGGRFANLLGSLRTLGLVEYPASGQVRARDILFVR